MTYHNMQSFTRNNVRRFGSGGTFIRSKEALSDDQIRTAAPSVFAEGKHESRSERYTHIPTSAVLEGLRREGFQPFSVVQGGSRDHEKRGFTKHMIRLRHQGTAENVGDSLPEVVLVNSHDGTSSYQLMAGFFRMVCSNGLIVADCSKGGAAGIRIPHKGDIVSNVIEGSYTVLGEMTENARRIEHMRTVELSPDEQRLLAEMALPLRFDVDAMPAIAPEQVVQARRSADVGSDLWRTFNRVQENLMNGGLRYVQRNENGRLVARRETRPVNGVDGDVKLNRQLWALAERMAELKAA